MIKFNEKFVDVFRVMASEIAPDYDHDDNAVKVIIETLLHAGIIKILQTADCPKTKDAILEFLANNKDYSGLILVEDTATEENNKS